MYELIPVISALAGTLLGSLISYLATIATIRRDEKSENRAIIISKLEEAHQVVRSIRQHYVETYTGLTSQLLVDKKVEAKGIVEIDRLFMLGNFYFPEILPLIDKLNLKRQEFGETIVEIIVVKVNRKRSNKEIFDELSNKHLQVDKACEEINNSISLIARKRLNIK